MLDLLVIFLRKGPPEGRLCFLLAGRCLDLKVRAVLVVVLVLRGCRRGRRRVVGVVVVIAIAAIITRVPPSNWADVVAVHRLLDVDRDLPRLRPFLETHGAQHVAHVRATEYDA